MNVAEIVDRLGLGERRLAELASLDAKTLARSYGPGKWSGVEILAHVADADLMWYARFLRAVAEEESAIVPFDGDRWVVELRYAERPPAVSLAAIRGVRAGLAHHLASLPRAALERKTFHPERGELTPLDIAQVLANHALHHAEQLEAIRDGRTWAPRAAPP